jgi:hypothetical protein
VGSTWPILELSRLPPARAGPDCGRSAKEDAGRAHIGHLHARQDAVLDFRVGVSLTARTGLSIRPSVQTPMVVGQIAIIRSVRRIVPDGPRIPRNPCAIGIRTVGRFKIGFLGGKGIASPGILQLPALVSLGIGRGAMRETG